MHHEPAATSKIPNRRQFLAMGAGVAGLSALAACGGGSNSSGNSSGGSAPTEAKTSGTVHLEMWAWSQNLVPRVKAYNASQSKVQVKLSLIPGGSDGGYAKMFSALKAGNAPDVVQMEYPEIPSFVLNDGLLDLKQYADKYKSQYVDWAWNQCVYNGAVYGLPSGNSAMGFYYRKDLFDKWGVQVPKTWDDYATAAQTIRGKGSYIATFPLGNAAWFAAMAWQAGALWYGTDGDNWVINIDSDQTRKVASYWQGLVEKKLVKTENDLTSGFWKDLQTGAIVSYVAPGWVITEVPTNVPKGTGKWAIADIPQWSTSTFASGTWGGSSYAALKGCKYPKEATDFAYFLTSNPKSLNVAGFGGMPSLKDLSQVTRVGQSYPYYGGEKVYTIFEKSNAHVNRKWGWIPDLDSTYNSLTASFSAAANGKGTFVDAVKKAQKDTVSALKAKGLQVKAG